MSSLVISEAKITRSSVQSLRGLVTSPGRRHTVSRTNSPVTSSKPLSPYSEGKEKVFHPFPSLKISLSSFYLLSI